MARPSRLSERHKKAGNLYQVFYIKTARRFIAALLLFRKSACAFYCLCKEALFSLIVCRIIVFGAGKQLNEIVHNAAKKQAERAEI